MRAEQATDPVAYHGEGPVWSERWGGLRWVDMLAGDVLFLTPGGTVERRQVGGVVAALRLLGSSKEGTPLETASTPVSAVQPEANARRTRKTVSRPPLCATSRSS